MHVWHAKLYLCNLCDIFLMNAMCGALYLGVFNNKHQFIPGSHMKHNIIGFTTTNVTQQEYAFLFYPNIFHTYINAAF